MTPDLSQLRDIHLPPGVSGWPPAIGWWILLALILLCALIAYLVYRRKRSNRWRRAALAELETMRTQPADKRLGGLSVLLRRVAISRFPREDVASLHGQSWLAFLDRSLGDGNAFQSDAGKLLSAGPYIEPGKLATNDLDALFSLSEKWIRKLPRGAQR